MFAKASAGSLYDDKAEAARVRKAAEADRLVKEDAEWSTDNEDRLATGHTDICT